MESTLQTLDRTPCHDSHRAAFPAVLRSFSIRVIVLTLLSWIVAVGVWARGRAESGGMWNHWDDRFTDLTHYDQVFVHLHQTAFFTGAERFAYPAPAAIIYKLLLYLGNYRIATFTLFILLLTVSSALLFFHALRRRGIGRSDAELFVVILVATSWPLLFLIERANIEAIVILLNFGGSLAYWRDRPKTAAVLWGLAASIKIYPVVLLVLFFNRKQVASALVGFGTFVSALLLSFWWVGPTIPIAAEGTVHGISGFVSSYANHSRTTELRWDHSYLALIKGPLSIARFHLSRDVTRIGSAYLVAAVLLSIILYFTHVRRLGRLNQFVLLSMAMVSLPPVSYDYTLCHLYPSFALLAFAAVHRRGSTEDLHPVSRLLLCFTILLASENFLYWNAFHLNGPLKGFTILCATIILLRNNIPESEAELAIAGAVRSGA